MMGHMLAGENILRCLVFNKPSPCFLNRHLRKTAAAEAEAAGLRRGTLFASGLIVGESIVGVLLAGLIVVSVSGGGGEEPLRLVGGDFAGTAEYLGLGVFILVLILFERFVSGTFAKK